MAALRYRSKEWTGTKEGADWLRWNDPAMSEEAFLDVWGADLEVAVEDDADPTTLILLPFTPQAAAQAIGVPLP